MVSLPTYDSTKVIATSLTPSVQGIVSVSGGGPWTWAASATLPVTLTRFDEVGLTFSFSVAQESERNLALAPKRPFTAATSDLAGTGETPTYWTLTLSTNLSSKSALPNVYMVRSPAAWTGSTNTPYTNRTNSGDESILIEDLETTSSAWVLNGSTYDLVWNFDFMTTGDNYLGSNSGSPLASTIRPFFDLVNSPTWNGLFQFHLDANAAISMQITAATFAGNVQRWHTGQMNTDTRQRMRIVHDYITGEPYESIYAVEDGYRGTNVYYVNYDPEDPLDTDPFTPPPGEGVTDDNIVNLE